MTHSDGGFFSALDADSEGVEGKFYTWTHDEAKDALGVDYEEAAIYFGVTQQGNWEHGSQHSHARRKCCIQQNDRALETEADGRTE
ncbi:MAG: hypothetical protein WDO15_20610 [Bacteroidota bacterium]